MDVSQLQLLITAKNLASQALQSAGVDIEKLEDKSQSLREKGINAISSGFSKMVDAAKAAVVAIGLTGVALAGYGTNLAISYEAQMSSIRALTGASTEQMKQVSDLSMKMGEDTKFSALEAAQGAEELLKAGVSLESVMGGSLKGALDLAAAGNISVADAATIASTALNAFKADNISVAQAADILAGAANASATDIGELKFGLQQVSAVASGVGLTFKDTATALAVFAQNGLSGSDAGTSLKTMLLSLQPQTKKQKQLFDELGLTTSTTTSTFVENTKATAKNAEKIKELQQQIEELTQKGLEKAGVAMNKNNEAINNYRNRIGELQDKIEVLKQKQSEWNEKTKESTKLANNNQIEKYTNQIAELSVKLKEVSTSTVSADLLPKDSQERIAKLKDKIQELGGVVGKTKDITVETGNAFFTAEGKIKPLSDIAGVLKEKLKDMTDQQRLSTLEQLFGSDAIRAANILYKEGTDGIKDMATEMGKFTAAQVASEKTNNLAGAMERLKGSVDTKLIELFSAPLPKASEYINDLEKAINNIDVNSLAAGMMQLLGTIKEIGGWIITNKDGIIAALGVVAGGLVGLGVASISLTGSLIALTAAAWAAFAPFLPFIAIGMLVAAAIMAIVFAVKQNWEVISKFLAPVMQFLAKIFTDFILPALAELWESFTRLWNIISPFVIPVLQVLAVIIGVVVFSAIMGFIGVIYLLINSLNWALNTIGNFAEGAGAVFNGFKTYLGGIINFITGVFTGNWALAWTGILEIFSGIFGAVVGVGKSIINTVIDTINGAIKGINRLTSFGSIIGVKIAPVPTIPRLAAGGSVKKGNQYIVGDNPDGSLNRTSELFVPDQNGQILSASNTQRVLSSDNQAQNNQPPVTNFVINLAVDMLVPTRQAVKELTDLLDVELRSRYQPKTT